MLFKFVIIEFLPDLPARLRGLLKKRTESDCRGSDKTVYINVLSESTLSTSSTMCALPLNSENHELDALTRQQTCRYLAAGNILLPN